MDKAGNQRPTVLLVEDVDWIRSWMKRRIEAEGFLVLEATDDREAFEQAECVRPDLIVTEEELPSFAPLLKRLREHTSLGSVPVVIVNPDAEEGARHGDARLLASFGELRRVLRHSTRPLRHD